MVHPRVVTGLLCLILSVLGVCIVSYLNILDMDSLLVEVSMCLPDSCNYQLHSRCLQCSHRFSDENLLVSMQRMVKEEQCQEGEGCSLAQGLGISKD